MEEIIQKQTLFLKLQQVYPCLCASALDFPAAWMLFTGLAPPIHTSHNSNVTYSERSSQTSPAEITCTTPPLLSSLLLPTRSKPAWVVSEPPVPATGTWLWAQPAQAHSQL